MDPLSGAASVIAVVSLVVQVSDSIQKLNDFRLSMKNAPQDIVQLGDQLVVLEDILKAISRKIQVANDLQSLEIEASHPLYGAMRICQNIASELKQVVEYLETRYRRRGAKNLRTSALARWKKGRIKELKDNLDFACKVLLLQGTLGCSSWQVEKVSVAIPETAEEALQLSQTAAETSCSQIPHIEALVLLPSANSPKKNQDVTIFSSPNNAIDSTIRNRRTILRERTWTSRFGILCIRTYTNKYDFCSNQNPESARRQTYILEETEFRFVPTWGSTGFQLSTSHSSNQWIPASLKSSFIVPDNSEIFELCLNTRCDNTSEVLNLFSQGRASPFDTNSRGETLLHAAAFACNPVLCKALLKSGADPLALDCLGKSPLEHAASGFPDYSSEVKTCRVLAIEGRIDLWDLLLLEDSDPALGWRWLSYLGGDLCLWILSHDKPWYDIHRMDRNGETLLDIVVRLWILDVFFRPADQSEWAGPMKWLIRAGSDIHHGYSGLAGMMRYSMNVETITRLWLDILRDCGVDVVRYLEEEKEVWGKDIIFVERYFPEYAKLQRYGACLVFEGLVVTMRYILPPEIRYEELPLFVVFKDILESSYEGFNALFSAPFFVIKTPSARERNKESIREAREREGKPVSLVRQRRKLLARLHAPRTSWSKARSEARRAMEAEDRRSIEGGEVLPRSHDPVKLLGNNSLQGALSYLCLNLRSLYAWAFLVVLTVSLGANVLLFRFWWSSW